MTNFYPSYSVTRLHSETPVFLIPSERLIPVASWQDRVNDPKPLSIAEQRQAARDKVRQCRLALKEAEEIRNKADLYLTDCNAALSKAMVELGIVDPRVKGLNLKVPLPKEGTQAHTVLITCDKPTTAMDLAIVAGWNPGHAKTMLSNAFIADHMTKPERGYYLTRYAILVALGVADNLDLQDDDL